MILQEEIEDYVENLMEVVRELEKKTELDYFQSYQIAVLLMQAHKAETWDLISDGLYDIKKSIDKLGMAIIKP